MKRFLSKTTIVILLILLIIVVFGIFFMVKRESNNKLREKRIDDDLMTTKALVDSYFYDEALDVLRESPFLDDERIIEEMTRVQELKNSLKLYEGDIYHIFFHSLIRYTSLAFDDDYKAEGYNYWMTTVSEFKKILEELYKNDFILIDIKSTIVKNADGTITKNNLYLPEGKKPIILSQDDVCYYDYMDGDGFANKLVIDENGEIKAQIEDENGNMIITDDGDVVPILDKFVKEHPSFSFQGAKGILAVTGYEGALGYNIEDKDLTESQRDMEKAELKKVSDKLKETGWRFASHSYTHNNFFNEEPISMELLKQDTTWFNEEIIPYIGKTSIYISPFGVHLRPDSEQMAYLNSQGFDIYCPVEANMEMQFHPNVLISKRLNVDGFTLMLYPERVGMFFDLDTVKNKILDESRPEIVLD